MKTYQNESQFVNNFAKDCKESIKSNGLFEAEWNGVNIIVTGMDNNNPSKVTMYQGTIDGVQFTGNITALKKKLNITFTKEYNRNSEAARTANTRVVIKTDSELSETAKVANERIMQALATLRKYSDRYGLGMVEQFVGIESVEALVLQALQRERGAAKKALEEREAKEREAKERLQAIETAKEQQKAALLAKIAEASANGNFDLVITLSAELKKLTK